MTPARPWRVGMPVRAKYRGKWYYGEINHAFPDWGLEENEYRVEIYRFFTYHIIKQEHIRTRPRQRGKRK